MVVVGSGGHTTEMLRLLEHVSSVYSPRYYVMADTDAMSEEKITKFETRELHGKKTKYLICKIPRSREVKQSYFSTVVSTLYSLLKCVPLVFNIRPDLVLCNGPGTCIPVCLMAFLLRVVGIKQTTVIFVESVCRVKTLSLSGRILYYFADHVLVQWPSLQNKYPLAAYVGRLV
ncbi:UDP-N-acetylglucosamine transferase subunit ALG14-like protein [Lamellibrachia satsuma]|nr:UDP-N-acetylglucosamine transferase subunit ALG14-like protein [Lamellibrachia satsuma]